MQGIKFGTQFLDPPAQKIGVRLIDPFGNQLGQQALRFFERVGQFGKPAGAACGSRDEMVVHGYSR